MSVLCVLIQHLWTFYNSTISVTLNLQRPRRLQKPWMEKICWANLFSVILLDLRRMLKRRKIKLDKSMRCSDDFHRGTVVCWNEDVVLVVVHHIASNEMLLK